MAREHETEKISSLKMLGRALVHLQNLNFNCNFTACLFAVEYYLTDFTMIYVCYEMHIRDSSHKFNEHTMNGLEQIAQIFQLSVSALGLSLRVSVTLIDYFV